MFPMAFIDSTIIPNTNANIAAENSLMGGPLIQREFIRFLGLRLVMVADPIKGTWHDYWKTAVMDDTTIEIPRNTGI